MDPASKRIPFWTLIKKGNMSSATAAVGNALLAGAKAFAAAFTGNGTMFASAMHSGADALNQGFVFVGSVLAEQKATRRFPTGFGRVINIFCMIAVLVVTIMAYETILKGIHLIQHPGGKPSGFWLNIAVLLLTLVVDGFVLIKAMKEIAFESRSGAKGLSVVPAAFRHVGRAAPPTRLVFYEDLVATSGAVLAVLAVIITSFTDFAVMDGMTTVVIGCLMILVAFRVGYDNMAGLIGVAAPLEVEEKVAKIIFSNDQVTDIYKMRVLQEGRYYHVEGMIELRPGLSLADADDIKFKVIDKLLLDPDIADVTISILEDNGVRNWRAGETLE
ncbi:cation diffusion facilitator family transporter [Cohnella candidum]|uniref:Cation diffusion facilitator family transporter n=1 Tax=Cohnella candidum TaxID=2674991 RepID=A0A3G3JVT9_9BACL|nr:cation diffusion facilitator family transporter [Cohnella candidum]AYQ72345.1 cation diffusion facilitator family transporter [Cohnella candidum]